MPNLEWALRCDYAFFDQERKACMIGLFDRIWATSFPVTHPLFFVVSRWSGEPGETFKQSTRIVAPDGSRIFETGIDEVAISPAGRAGVVSRFVAVTFQQPGAYQIHLLANEEIIDSIPLTLAQRGEPGQ